MSRRLGGRRRSRPTRSEAKPSGAHGLGRRLRAAVGELAALDALELVPRLTLLYLVLNPGVRWPERVPVLVLAGLGWLSPALARAPGLWLALFGVGTARLALVWPLADNHDYLASLWCLALATCLGTPRAERALATNARLLIGLGFGFATLWKAALSPDFVDGTFFRVTLLGDARFADLALLLGGMSDARFEANEAARAAYHAGGVRWSESGFVEPAALRALAQALTAWTLLVEAAIALCFLWPGARGPARWRNAVLIGFCATAFAVATVTGFGWLLVVLGVAQCGPGRTRLFYLASFFLILVYAAVPWSGWLVAALHG